MHFWHILAAKMAFIIIMEVRQRDFISTHYLLKEQMLRINVGKLFNYQ